MQRADWLVLDLETTGLGIDAAPVAVAVVGAGGEVLLDALIRPTGLISPGAQRVHGLTDEAVAGAPEFSLVHERLWALACDKTVVAFNAAFDRSVLDRECRRVGAPSIGSTWECALERYEEWRGFRASLATACEIEGLRIRPRHVARGDAEATWLLLRRMAGLPL